MQNNQQYFCRWNQTETDRLSLNGKREYPEEIFPFGNEDIELFAHHAEKVWRVTEKKTGLLICLGADMDSVVKEAHQFMETYGKDKFIELIKDTLAKLNDGKEFDYQKQEWVSD